ncbi:MAG TPA: hypothetical protein VM187_05255 [Niastella sp.]|nr:hypothetical protein [Niastella sp.]
MAKSAKKPKPKPSPNTTANTKTETMITQGLNANSLVVTEAPHSHPVDVSFTFTSGVGQATAVLFRKGVLINMQSISKSGNVNFSEVQIGDVISISGVCAGKAAVAINTSTTPVTPEKFNAGLIIAGYLVN